MHVCAWVWIASSLLGASAGEVEIAVRGPDGALIANRRARVVEVAPFPSSTPDGPKPREVTTDAEGRARFSVEVGLRRFHVRVPGAGFGGTGLFEVMEKRVARPDLPRLARFARVEGSVDRALLEPGLRVEAAYSTFNQPSADNVSVPCDASGRFVFDEVIPGEIQLRLFQNQRPIAVEWLPLMTEPGQTRRDVVVTPPRPPDPALEREQKATRDRLSWIKGKQEITWVEGTVRDMRGAPLQNAEVMVKAVYYGGRRNYSDFRTTHTDARGHYSIRGPHSNFQDAFTVVVRAPGRAPLLAYARAPGWDDKGPRGPLDLTVPDRGGSLVVRVLKDGKPAADVPVALHEQRVVERIWSRGTNKAQALNQLFHPLERTDKDGIARFKDLYPCRYELRVSEDGSGLGKRRFPGAESVGQAVFPAVDIAAGEDVSMTVTLQPEPGFVKLQASRPDGTIPGHEGVTFFFGLRETYAMASMNFNADGVGTHRFEGRGLWAVGLQFRETESPGMPTNWEPYYRGSALLPVSPAYPLESPVKVMCDRHLPGSIQARLLGIDGKPTRGTILLMSEPGASRGEIDRAASTEENGVARFNDLPSGSYHLRGSMETYPPPYRPSGHGAFPDDAALGDQVVFPVEEVKVESGAESRVRLQPVRAGYVRGTINPSPGATASDYYVVSTHAWWKVQSAARRDAASGAYLCGPLLPGKVEVRLVGSPPGQASQTIPRVLPLAPGEVAHRDLEAKGEPAQPNSPESSVSLGMGGLSTRELPPEALAGTVVHADGKTPAFGAHAVLMVPRENRPTASAVSDAAGRLTWTGLWILRGRSTEAPDPPGQVTVPTVVVSVPGHAGAAVIPIDPADPKPFRAVLPAPRSASGRVTLGGQAMNSQDARVRVIAGHQGRGVLDGPLSVEAIVDADGRFVLRGLTPGTYQVQASRDGIWLSRSVTLKLAAAENPAELALDLPDPGAAVTLALVDDNGHPAGRKRVTLARPEGPLRELWPEQLATGGDGTLTVRGLEAGTHQVMIEGENAARKFQVPSVSQAPTRVVLTVNANAR